VSDVAARLERPGLVAAPVAPPGLVAVTVRGRRLPDTDLGHLAADYRPGDFWRILTRDGTRPAAPVDVCKPDHEHASNLTGGVWYVVTPNGVIAKLCLHTVREEADGTVSVRPGDGSSNSVLVEGYSQFLDQRVSWHGFVEHGEWSEA
jgi:hypothetical protein